jgi:carboxyl-terminal processing protease
VNWELSAAPYLPIYRRRLWRRRIAIGVIALLIAVPSFLYYRHLSAESIGARVFDDVEASVAAAYYDPSYHGLAWTAIAAQYRPLVESAPDASARYSVLRRMLAVLGDSHTMAFSPLEVDRVERRSDAGVSGALITPIGGQSVVVAVAPHSPADRAGLRRGAIVLSADPEIGPPGIARRYVVKDPLTGRVLRTSLRLAPAMAVDDPRGPEVDWNVVAPGVGYLRIGSFPDALDDVLGWAMQEIGAQPSLILDLRSNPGGMLDAVDATAGIFLPKGTLVVTGWRRVRWFGPQRFSAADSAGAHYAGAVYVLVDRSSESGAETLAAALQAYHRATIVGVRTAGKVMGVDLEEPLADGGLLRVATLDMIAPGGVRLEGRGVSPDVIVDRSASDVARGLDPQLRTAIALAHRAVRPVGGQAVGGQAQLAH